MIVLPPQYYGSVQYYAAMAAADHVVVDTGLRYDKRFKSTHRCDIVDTRGRISLTVPVCKPTGRLWADVAVSDHGQWWSDHLVSLESAYGRTPFFEYYIDRLMPWLQPSVVGMSVIDLDIATDTAIRQILHLPTLVEYKNISSPQSLEASPHSPHSPLNRPYWQVRAHKLGFQPGLSILDLIFNLGPEATLYLYE